MLDFDQFGRRVQFNFDGLETISSMPGCIVSSFIIMLLLAYASYTLSVVITHANPLITSVTVPDFYDSSLKLSFSDIGFKVAFCV